MAGELNKAVLNTLLGLCLHDGTGYNFLLGVTSTETIGSGHDPGREGQFPPKLLSHFPFWALDPPGISFLLSFVEPDTSSLPPTQSRQPSPRPWLVPEAVTSVSAGLGWTHMLQGHGSLVCEGATETNRIAAPVPGGGCLAKSLSFLSPLLSSVTQRRCAGSGF